MRVHGQYAKQRALAKLRTLLLAQPLSQDTLEVHHRLFQLLLCLAQQPLKHTYEAPALLLPTDSTAADALDGLQPLSCLICALSTCANGFPSLKLHAASQWKHADS